MEPVQRTILAICGSTRQHSSNHELIKVIGTMESDKFNVTLFEGLNQLPHFNPDLDNDHPPEQVASFRRQVKNANGILICTPEYAMGVPGTLKNALDWTVSSMEFSNKPVALITASTLGHKAHASLLETLKIIECNIPGSSQLVISHIKTKLKDEKITDAATLEQVKQVMQSLNETIGTNHLF